MFLDGASAMWFSLLNIWSRRELRRQCAGWVVSKVLSFVVDVVALFCVHCNTKLDSTCAALESSASTLHSCWNVSA